MSQSPNPGSNDQCPGLVLRDLTKRYPGVVANDRVSLTLAPGEVLGVLGENGAGKSTLMNILSGLIGPDEGEILIDGMPVRFASCADAIAHGIAMVHQHFKLVPSLTAAENVALGLRGPEHVLERVAARMEEIGAEIGLPVEPGANVETLDIGGQQRVEIMKALYRGARYLILDEPTAVLSRAESSGLFAMVRRLAERGVGIILISHKLDDIFEACGRVMVMRAGRVVDEAPIAARDADALVRAMIGGEMTVSQKAAGRPPGEILLSAGGLTIGRERGGAALNDVSFALRAGEILALAGVEGNGQKELVEALTGLTPPLDGEIALLGEPIPRRGAAGRLRARGLRHIPEDRHRSAILPPLTLVENYLLSHLGVGRFNRWGWLKRAPVEADVRSAIDSFSIVTPGPATTIGSLSGGNQQKLVLARELADGVRVLIASHPTRGLDVRTIGFVQATLLAQAASGLGVLLVSSDLAEIWQIADRVMVAAGGRIRGPVSIGDTSIQEVGGWMAGR